jgi:hypothetical protein
MLHCRPCPLLCPLLQIVGDPARMAVWRSGSATEQEQKKMQLHHSFISHTHTATHKMMHLWQKQM